MLAAWWKQQSRMNCIRILTLVNMDGYSLKVLRAAYNKIDKTSNKFIIKSFVSFENSQHGNNVLIFLLRQKINFSKNKIGIATWNWNLFSLGLLYNFIFFYSGCCFFLLPSHDFMPEWLIRSFKKSSRCFYPDWKCWEINCLLNAPDLTLINNYKVSFSVWSIHKKIEN